MPTSEDLAGLEPRTLDEESVLKNFLGKTREDIRKILPQSGHLQEDFMWMWPAGLRYYLPAVLDYLRSDESCNDFEMSEGLLCSLAVQVKSKGLPEDVLNLVANICDVVNRDRSKYIPGTASPGFERYIRDIRESTRPT